MPTRRWTRCRHVILWLFKIRYDIGVFDMCRASVGVRHVSDTDMAFTLKCPYFMDGRHRGKLYCVGKPRLTCPAPIK